MGVIKDKTGMRFGRLVVIRLAGLSGGDALWLCKCDCGKKVKIPSPNLANGYCKSCGCLRREMATEWFKKIRHLGVIANTIHGGARCGANRIPEYFCWRNMLTRCSDSKSPAWKHYGGRGIKVCDRWLDFRNFFADMGKRPDGLSIDRINVNGNYEPTNCRWATRSEQARNRRRMFPENEYNALASEILALKAKLVELGGQQ